MKRLILTSFISIIVRLVFAQPQSINYQGVARNIMGVPLANRNISLQLSILDSSATGQAVYVETQSATTSSSGLFNLSIGLGTVVSGTFSSISWGQGDKWMKTEMDTAVGNNFQLIGTTQFLSVPFALYSNKSNNGMPAGVNTGDMLYWNGSTWTQIPSGSNGSALALCNGVPTWGGCPIVLTTASINNIYTTVAISGGNITSNGGALITARGVCWNTSTNPSIANNKTIDGIGIGAYSSSITGLSSNTTYYVRAYATNSLTTSYGNEFSFTTFAVANLPSVTICSQIWQAQNLSVSTYRNGDSIPKVTDPTIWLNLTTGAYCYYNNDSATYAAVYGKLYNWYAVNDPRGLAPTGWHIPGDAEWASLEICLGDRYVAGGKMKETGTVHWLSPNVGASNSSGFTGLPGGFRDGNGTSYLIGSRGTWWSSSEFGSPKAYNFTLYFDDGSDFRNNNEKNVGHSVRCLRD